MGQRTTESEVGFLSKLVTILYTKKAEAIVKSIEDGMDVDMAVDHRVLQAMGKWVLITEYSLHLIHKIQRVHCRLGLKRFKLGLVSGFSTLSKKLRREDKDEQAELRS